MGNQGGTLSGPDLEKEGVAVSALTDGGTLLGHAMEEAVVLARTGASIPRPSAPLRLALRRPARRGGRRG